MKFLHTLMDKFDRILDLMAFLAGVLLSFLAICICFEVLLRYFLGYTIFWVKEVSEFILLYITFLGGAWLLKREGHVKMDLLATAMKPRSEAFLTVATSILGAITCLIVTFYGIRITWYNWKAGIYIATLLEPPKYLILAIIPVGSFFLFVQFLRRSYGAFRTWRSTL